MRAAHGRGRVGEGAAMSKDLLDLPLAIQLSLGAGYLAYLLAYAGIRKHHTTADALFGTLIFGLFASAVIYLAGESVWFLGLAAALPILAGALWRWKLRGLFKSLLRYLNISWSDDTPNAWLTITSEHTDARPSQIAVDTKNGRTLLCEDTRVFGNSPHGPAIFGLDGSVAFYVTDERRADGEWFKHSDVIHPHEGDRLTFIPADQIERVELRLWSRANEMAAGVEVEEETGEEGPDAVGAPSGAPNPERM